MKKSFSMLFAILFAINFSSQAEDFSVVNNGDTIYYNITSSTWPLMVEVTYKDFSFTSIENEYSGVVSIPDSVFYNGSYYKVTSFGQNAFRDCETLTSVLIPNTVVSIGNYAFYGCNSLNTITIPNTVTSIGSSVFIYTPYYNNMPDGLVYINNILHDYKGIMPANTSINILDGTISISEDAFFGCFGLIAITIPNSITYISDWTFSSCINLASITIPTSVTSIGEYAFHSCKSLASITIPNSVTSINSSAFTGCSKLTSITIPASVTSIGERVFENCTSLDTVYFNAVNCSKMGDFYFNTFHPTFEGCSNLSEILIGSEVKNIPNNAFYGCDSILNLTIPDSVLFIGNNALKNMEALKNLTIGSSVNNIMDSAFFNCENIINMHVKANNPPLVYANTFYNVNPSVAITVSCASLPIYKSTTLWDLFTNYKGDEIPIIPEGLNVQVKSNSIELNWQDNGNAYIIYRNNDSIANTTDSIYIDYDVVNEESYCYKVKSLNGNCESEFSNEVCKTYAGLENIQTQNITSKLYPNPSEGKARLNIQGLNAEANILVYDMVGRVVQRYKINQGENELEIDLTGHAKGVYTIRIINNSINQSIKLIVQ